MDTRKVATELRLNQWAVALRERKESGLSVRRWCMENAVNEKTYYYWQRKLREVSCRELVAAQSSGQNSELAPLGWASCEVVSETSAGRGITIEIGKAQITATQSTDMELLGKICRVLSDAAL